MNEREYLAATLWTRADWGRDRAGDWKTAVRIGAPTKAGDMHSEPPSAMHVRADMHSETRFSMHIWNARNVVEEGAK